MQNDNIPKVFISYSWSSDALVLDLAQRLVSHGVDVVLDKWELKEGNDKYKFMERCVNDAYITKVLIICDKAYAQKANDRTGGVGDETVIISSEIYGNAKQEKFIPIVAERDEEGKEYVPTYIKTRIYIDLSDPEKYEAEYEKLLRNIYEKPQFVKPKLGKRPEWLDEEKTNFFPLKDLIRQIQGSNTERKRKEDGLPFYPAAAPPPFEREAPRCLRRPTRRPCASGSSAWPACRTGKTARSTAPAFVSCRPRVSRRGACGRVRSGGRLGRSGRGWPRHRRRTARRRSRGSPRPKGRGRARTSRACNPPACGFRGTPARCRSHRPTPCLRRGLSAS